MIHALRAHARRACVVLLTSSLAVGTVAVNDALTQAASAASTYNVNTTSDTTGAGYCATTSAPCTLRAAVAAANATTGATINVPAGSYVLAAGPLTLSKSMTIVGARRQPGAAATTIDGGAKDRVFVVAATGITIDGVVVRNGVAPKNASGGGILVNKNSALTLTKSTVTGNTATQGGGIEVDGTATVDQSTLSGNTASGKGGGLYDAGTVTIQNSTVDGNTANGGGGIASAATTTVLASTVTGNTSNNSNGGGLYRNGGTFIVTGSIIATNNASSGRDCYGSPSFTGTNVLQYTPGCNPSGGTILVLDPMLGALGDNGGPTQTRRPLPGSAAINAYDLPCATSVDQRATARPQPSGGKCDVGAVEIEPLGVDLSLTTNTDTIAPFSSIRIGDLPPGALLPGSETTTELGVIKRGVIKRGVIKRGSLGEIELGVIKRGVIKRGVIKRGAIDLGVIKRGVIKRGVIKRGDFPLSDMTLLIPGGWDAIFVGTPLEGAPINSLTLNDAVPYLIDKGVTLDEIDLGPLETLPFASWLLADNPLAHIPLTPELRNATDQARLGAWCTALKTATQDPCASLEIDPNASPASTITLFDISVFGFLIDTVKLDQIAIRDVINEASMWFGAMPLSTFAVDNTALTTIPVSALPAGYVDCTKVTCSTATLGVASLAGAISPTKTLLDLFTDPGTAAIPQLAQFTLADLYQGLIDPEDLPWDQLDLAHVYMQNGASPAPAKLTYTMTITVKGASAATSVDFQLPPGFDAVRPGSLKIDGAPLPDPLISDTNLATLPLGTLAPGVHTATFDTYAGLNLGPATATAKATVTAGSDSATAQASKTVTVVEAFEGGPTNPETVTVQPNTPTLYLAQLSYPLDRDLYKFEVPNDGTTTGARIVLGNLPVDYDMVLYGPQRPLLRNAPKQRLLPVNDGGIDLSPTDATVSPDTVQDVPLAPPSYAPGVVAVAANRGLADEEISLPSLAPGQYAIQISGYNGADSPKPYSLRMAVTTTDSPECAPPPLRNSGDTGPLTGPVTLGANPHVLFVVPQQRLFATFGAARTQPAIDKLKDLATDVGGTILPVDNAGFAVAQKYAAWDTNRCSVAAANDVVREIGNAIDAARAANPNIDSVVLVGDDSVLPMARVPDTTVIGNEGTYGSELMTKGVGPGGVTAKSNELAAALLNGYVLTDDAYGTSAGTAVNDHELFVPDVALGRLVETPEDVVAAANTFLDPANKGTLDASSANSALVTGFDFMINGAQQVASNLTANGKTVDDSLIGNSWSADDLRAKLFNGSAPGINSINTHYDQNHLLPAKELDAQNHLDLFGAAELTDPNVRAALSRRLLFNMGCHSGLSVSDISLGSTTDWAQAITGADQGGLYAGNTGYGLGDDQLVALTERLMALYAKALDGTVTAGRALMIAKQQYLASTQVLTPYDEKVLQQVVFYGLPMYATGAIPATNQSLQRLSADVQLMSATTSGSVSISGTDPRTNLPVAPLSLQPDATRHDTPDGSYYDVNGQTITAQYRPIQPGTTLDVTQSAGGSLTKRAHGVLITGLSSVDHEGFTPRYFLPTPNLGDGDPALNGVGDAVFPSSLTRVSSSIGADGEEQQALLTAGQARAPQADGTVTQRLFAQIGGLVEYADVNNTDFTAPYIATNHGEIVGGTAGFTVVTDGTARRVYVLYKSQGTDGAWKGVDLVPTALADGTIRWWGGGPTNADAVEFATQAVDASGNVAVSNNKVENFLASKLVNAGALSITLTSGSAPVNGWYHGSVTATIAGPPNAVIQFSLDGGSFTSYPTGGVQIGGDGVHHLLARDNLGNFAVVDVLIDSTAPSVSAAVDPGSAASATDGSGNTWYDGPVSVTVTGNDGVDGSGISSITYSATGATPIGATTIDDGSSPPLDRSPVGTASASVSIGGTGTTVVTGSARDSAGNNSVNATATVRIDTQGPTFNCGSADSAWHNTDVLVSCTASDAGAGLLNASDASFTLTTNVAANTQTANASTNTRAVCDRLGHCSTAGPITGIKIDKVAPTASITSPLNGASFTIGQSVNAAYSCADPAGGSGLAATNNCVGTVANGAAIDTTTGAHTFTVTAKDAAGNLGTTTVTYTVGYRICLQYDPTKPQPMTGTVPIKLQLCNAAGTNLSSSNIKLVATRYEGGQLPSPNWQGGSNTGFEFRFASGSYIYNLDPTNPPLSVGSHTLYFVVKGTTAPEYAAPFALK